MAWQSVGDGRLLGPVPGDIVQLFSEKYCGASNPEYGRASAEKAGDGDV